MLIKKDFCLKPFNTFGVKAFARRLSVIGFPDNLEELYENDELNNNSILILGEGSNILFTGHYEGLVLLNQIRRMEVIKEDNDSIYLKVNGGENWSILVDYTVDNGWGGLENVLGSASMFRGGTRSTGPWGSRIGRRAACPCRAGRRRWSLRSSG